MNGPHSGPYVLAVVRLTVLISSSARARSERLDSMAGQLAELGSQASNFAAQCWQDTRLPR